MELWNLLLTGGGLVAAAGVGNAIYESVNDIRVDKNTGLKYSGKDNRYVGGKARRAGVAGEQHGVDVVKAKVGAREPHQYRRFGPNIRPMPGYGEIVPGTSSQWVGSESDWVAREKKRIAQESKDAGQRRGTPALLTGRPTEYGKAGGAIGANTKFSEYTTAAGAKGEAMLGKIMFAFFSKHKIPARIFHGVYFPGSKEADIDHVIVIGKAVYLVDAKLYKADSYWISPDMTTIMSARGFTKRTSMGIAYQKTRQALGTRGSVIAARVCLQSSGRNEIRTRRSGKPLDVCTPAEMLQEILQDVRQGKSSSLALEDNASLLKYFKNQLK